MYKHRYYNTVFMFKHIVLFHHVTLTVSSRTLLRHTSSLQCGFADKHMNHVTLEDPPISSFPQSLFPGIIHPELDLLSNARLCLIPLSTHTKHAFSSVM